LRSKPPSLCVWALALVWGWGRWSRERVDRPIDGVAVVVCGALVWRRAREEEEEEEEGSRGDSKTLQERACSLSPRRAPQSHTQNHRPAPPVTSPFLFASVQTFPQTAKEPIDGCRRGATTLSLPFCARATESPWPINPHHRQPQHPRPDPHRLRSVGKPRAPSPSRERRAFWGKEPFGCSPAGVASRDARAACLVDAWWSLRLRALTPTQKRGARA
jgi:hypothetical protein